MPPAYGSWSKIALTHGLRTLAEDTSPLKRTPPPQDEASEIRDVLDHLAAGRHADAVALGGRLLRGAHEGPPLLHALGLAHHALRQQEQAIEMLRRAKAGAPGDKTIRLNLAAVLDAAQRPADALREYVALAQDCPDDAECFVKLAAALRRAGLTDRAAEMAQQALALDPDHAQAHHLLANIYAGAARLDNARQHREAAAALAPDDASYQAALGDARLQCGDYVSARAAYDRACALSPTGGLLVRRALAMPVVAESAASLAAQRGRAEDEIAALEGRGLPIADPARDVAKSFFQFGAQGIDDRPFLERLARLYLAACPALAYEADHCRGAAGTRRGRIRVAFVSSYLRDHTLGRLLGPTIERLARSELEVAVAGFGPPADDMARRIASAADIRMTLPRDLAGARQALAEARFDIIVYAGIGMDPLLYFLSFARLAPVQCTGWGHPITSGVPAMDVFLSSDLVELPEADTHYSEKLVRFASLGTCYRRPDTPILPRPEAARRLGLDPSRHIYLYPYNPLRFPSEFDAVADDILGRDPAAEIVMLEGPSRRHRALLEERLARSAPRIPGRIRFLERRQHNEFLALYPAAHVVLDPFIFSGGNTSFEAFAAGIPIVTLPGTFRRSRLTFAMYRRMGLADCVASDAADYAAKATAIATTPALRDHLGRAIAERADVLYDDEQAVRDYETFFLQALGQT
ncbi:MAG: tetratricopeptide repeat protein [Alphaproteobacteria bacterium]|nr:tetratricopeptide repeat protein [Alphaproteobacteria bacterium]